MEGGGGGRGEVACWGVAGFVACKVCIFSGVQGMGVQLFLAVMCEHRWFLHNKLTGSLPTELGRLTKLTEL